MSAVKRRGRPPKAKASPAKASTKKAPPPSYEGKHAAKLSPPPRKPWQWQPGQSGNPQGGRAHDPALRAMKALTKQELVEVGNLIVKGNYDELEELRDDPNASVLQRMLGSVVDRVLIDGDMRGLDILLNRLVGKVKDEVEYSPSAGTVHVVTLPSNGRESPDVKPPLYDPDDEFYR